MNPEIHPLVAQCGIRNGRDVLERGLAADRPEGKAWHDATMALLLLSPFNALVTTPFLVTMTSSPVNA